MSLAPTLQLEEAGRRCWDVVVIGAGPAGTTAARRLAQMGKAVLLVDRQAFPRWKVCGCCLNARALAVLHATGLGRLVTRCGAVPLQRIELATRHRHAALPLSGSMVLSREAFDAALLEAAIQAGAAFLPGTVATLGEEMPAARHVLLRHGPRRQEIAARLVLAAVGLGGLGQSLGARFAAAVTEGSRIGAGVVVDGPSADYRPGTIHMACGTGGYLGLVQREDGRLNLAAAFDDAQIRRSGGLGNAAAMILAEVGWPPLPALARLPWRGTPRLTRRPSQVSGNRILVLGDAAGYIEPFTGEGIAWALAAGAAMAMLPGQAQASWRPEWAEQWTTLYTNLIVRRQQSCRLAAQVLRHPSLVRLVIGVLAHAPGLAKPFLRYLARE
jgi:flavin-dependent dehydrogenase